MRDRDTVFAGALPIGQLITPADTLGFPSIAANADSVPSELRGDDRTGYLHWLRAGRDMQALRGLVPPTMADTAIVNRPELRRRLNAIDVSMGQGTQRKKLKLMDALQRPPSPAVRFSAIRAEYRDFERRVWEKVRNHCVPLTR